MNLEDKLIKHYDCFNRERFYLDVDDEKLGYVSIVTSSMRDPCPFKLCRGIAKFVAKNIRKENYSFIYVGPYFFHVNKLTQKRKEV